MGSTVRTPDATRTRRRSSSPTSVRRIGQAGARAGSWTGSRSTRTARTRASRRPLPTRTRRRSGSRTTASSSASSVPRSTAPPSPARRSRSSTRSTGSRPRSRPARRRSTRAPSRRRRGRSTIEAGGHVRGSAGARVLPAHRRRVLRLPRTGRDCARVLAVRCPLRRRHTEGQPPARPRFPGASTHGVDRAVPRSGGSPSPRRRSGIRPASRSGGQGSVFACAAASTACTPSGSASCPRARRRAKRGYARAGRLAIADLGLGRVARGNYYFTVSLLHPVNPASEPTGCRARPFSCRRRALRIPACGKSAGDEIARPRVGRCARRLRRLLTNAASSSASSTTRPVPARAADRRARRSLASMRPRSRACGIRAWQHLLPVSRRRCRR